MFELTIVKNYKCKDGNKIVETVIVNTDTKENNKVRFTLDEIANVKSKIGNFYFVQFKNNDEEYALPCKISDDDFIIEFEE